MLIQLNDIVVELHACNMYTCDTSFINYVQLILNIIILIRTLANKNRSQKKNIALPIVPLNAVARNSGLWCPGGDYEVVVNIQWIFSSSCVFMLSLLTASYGLSDSWLLLLPDISIHGSKSLQQPCLMV